MKGHDQSHIDEIAEAAQRTRSSGYGHMSRSIVTPTAEGLKQRAAWKRLGAERGRCEVARDYSGMLRGVRRRQAIKARKARRRAAVLAKRRREAT